MDRIYRDEHGALPDFSHFDRRRPTWHRWVIGGGLITLALLAVTAWAGFLIFKPYTTSSGGNVAVTVDAPPTASVGQEVTYQIRIANGDHVPVARMTVEARLPPDFTVITADPAPDDARGFRWTIGTLPARGERRIEIRGRLYGIPSAEHRMEVVTIYRPANFNADFQTIANAVTVLNASPLTIAITGPTEAVPGERVTYTVAYEHTGDVSTPTTVVTVDVPPTFTLTETTPNRPRTEELLWTIGEIAPRAKGTITIVGTFTGDAHGELVIGAAIALTPTADRRLAQTETRMTTRMLGGDIVVMATVNDQTAGIDGRPGDILQFRIALRNGGEAELRNLVVRAVFDAPSTGDRSILDFNRLEDPGNGTTIGEQISPTIRRGTITWTGSNLPDLVSLKPGEQRMLAFTLPIRAADTITFPTNAKATFTTSVEIPVTGTVEKSRIVRSAPVEIRIIR